MVCICWHICADEGTWSGVIATSERLWMGSPPDGDMNATLGKALDRFEVQACRASMRHGIVSAPLRPLETWVWFSRKLEETALRVQATDPFTGTGQMAGEFHWPSGKTQRRPCPSEWAWPPPICSVPE